MPGAQNCPKHLVITSIQECKTASSLLGIEFVGQEDFIPKNRPAGCFWGTGENGQYEKSHMNRLLDSDLTSFRTDWTWVGGICKSKSKI